VVNGSCPLREISKFLKFPLMNSISDRSRRYSAKFQKNGHKKISTAETG
jgi:hypothetical protein